MKILFISRAYPPITGGIENQNYELSVWLSKICTVKIIANTRGKSFLPIFLPYAMIRAFFIFRNYDAMLLGDGVLAIIGWKLKLFYKKPVISIIHGLDLTYKSWLYQRLWVGFFLKKLDKLIAVGQETVRVGLKKNIPSEKLVFIPNGVDEQKHIGNYSRSELEKFLGENISGKKVLLTSGRLAKRKGVAWFINEVMPGLDKNIIYLVAGNGPDRENIKGAIAKNDLGDRVKILGYIKDADRDLLFNTCDIFVQPNIKVEGDMEGFGISVIEAASCGLPVIASRLEGLQDAIKDSQNGFLVEPYDVQGYINKINELLGNDSFRKEFGKKARRYVVENYSWKKISRKYLEEIERAVRE
jgi:glycosyltransferase involved in cell wall biosynthesis